MKSETSKKRLRSPDGLDEGENRKKSLRSKL
jgi:hypothetical protein